jgi:catechol 2,3-dioxygenase-like lactoylglutathione lyase family enzyme
MAVYTGVNHLAMVTNDMDATIHCWRDLLGARLVAGQGNGTCRHYPFDSNRILIEFSAPVKSVDVRTNPTLCDSHPARAAQEGADPVSGRWPAVDCDTPVSDDTVYPGEGRFFKEGCESFLEAVLQVASQSTIWRVPWKSG